MVPPPVVDKLWRCRSLWHALGQVSDRAVGLMSTGLQPSSSAVAWWRSGDVPLAGRGRAGRGRVHGAAQAADGNDGGGGGACQPTSATG